MQLGLNFSDSQLANLIPMDGEVVYIPSFLGGDTDRYYAQLQSDIQWKEEEITMFGKRMKVPRLVAWYGDANASYSYSGIHHEPLPWTPLLKELKEKVELQAGQKYNSVLLNLYRNGSDSMGWHSDDEPELGQNPSIASISLGEARMFHLRHKAKKADNIKIELGDGSLLLMRGATQHYWQHQVPKSKKELGPRINLTFRFVI